ncbi:MAG: 2-oxo acid dehydrogenase subunit E2 [Clostridiales bacterium]|nr:2-oxo acid dehydrogenase subunit E2 [Clostridiales bacterium]
MSKQILMPQYGLTMEEGAVEKWLIKEGDVINEGDVIAEIVTDKLTNDLVSEVGGTVLKLVAPEGEDIPVKGVLAIVGEPGEQVNLEEDQPEASQAPVPEAPAPAAPGKLLEQPLAAGGRIKISPFAKKIAEKNQLDYSRLAGSGPSGRIVAKDVEAALATGALSSAAPAIPASPPPAPMAGDEVVKMSKMRKIVAERMSASAREIPAVSQDIKADVTKLLALRAQINEGRENRVSLNDFVLKAVAKSLRAHMEVNASLDGAGGIIRHHEINVGMAVAVPGGLMVPVIRGADTKSLEALSNEAKDLAVRARDSSLDASQLQGSTFSVSNLGMYGITSFTPIINQPNAAILGVCAVEDVVALDKEGQLYNKKMMTLSLTYDHRLLDGAEAAEFQKTLKTLLEDPLQVIL